LLSGTEAAGCLDPLYTEVFRIRVLTSPQSVAARGFSWEAIESSLIRS